MSFPEWADEQLSADMPMYRSRGESQELEYMQKFPDNARDLGKEIAAFATSNSGTILIGISDAGELIGLDDCQSMGTRDQFIRRLEGICKGPIKPTITPNAKFAVESGKVILCIIVPKGNQPIYYCNNVPYIRHLTESRPAEPLEVYEKIQTHIAASGLMATPDKEDLSSKFYSELAQILIGVHILASEADERSTNPWLELMRSRFIDSALALLELAENSIATTEGLKDRITEVADLLEKAGHFQMYIGCWQEYKLLLKNLSEKLIDIIDSNINSIPVSKDSQEIAKRHIGECTVGLNGLVARMDKMVEYGKVEDAMIEASNIGNSLLRLTYYKLDIIEKDIMHEIAEIARRLHVLETTRMRPDGGRSLNIALDIIRESNSRMLTVCEKIEQGQVT